MTTIKIDDKIFQEKDIDQKPEPFYHLPEVYDYVDPERGELNRVRWVEDAELKVKYMAEKQKEAIKAELAKIYEAQDPLLQEWFRPVKEAFEKDFMEGNTERVVTILTSPNMPDNVKPIAQAIYDKYIELTGGVKCLLRI